MVIFLSAIVCICAAVGYGQREGGGAIAAIDEPAEAAGGGRTSSSLARRRANTVRPADARPAKASVSRRVSVPKPRRWDGFVVGDEYTFMNFEVISAEKPYHTREAKTNGASGLVQVEILIDTDGRVIKARARTGNKLLHAEAERAALASRFSRFTFGGKPARAIGFLVYRFGSEERSLAAPERKRVAPAYDLSTFSKKND